MKSGNPAKRSPYDSTVRSSRYDPATDSRMKWRAKRLDRRPMTCERCAVERISSCFPISDGQRLQPCRVCVPGGNTRCPEIDDIDMDEESA